MIQGRFVKDGSYTEIYLGNGITELVPVPQYDPHTENGLSYFWWPKEVKVEAVKKRNRDWIWWTTGAAVFLLGASFGAIMQQIYYCVPLFIGSMAYIGLVIWANRR